MKVMALIPLAFLASCMSTGAQQTPPPGSADEKSQLAIYLGQRSLDEDYWAPLEDQPTFGIEYSQQESPDSLGWEIGIAGSSDETTLIGIDVTGSTGELYGGIRKNFGTGNVRPYIGGGASFIRAKIEGGGASEDDTSIAGYAHGGVEFLVSQTFFLGVDLRALFGSDITIGGANGDADYTQLALTLGWRF